MATNKYRQEEREKCSHKEWGSRRRHNIGRSGRRTGNGIFRSYFAVPLVLAAVLLTAFFTPQIMFRIQDSVLHRRTELSRRERMDLEALSGSYEKSLYKRMLNFAEGLALGDSFYVTSKNLADSQTEETLEKLLYSGDLYQGMTQQAAVLNLFPFYTFDGEFTVEQWKQYVVYSDNYARGVNFILWYIELAFTDDITLKLLTDAETGTLYALKTEGGSRVGPIRYVIDKYKELFAKESLTELWLLCASHFEAVTSDGDLLRMVMGSSGAGPDTEKPSVVESEYDAYYERGHEGKVQLERLDAGVAESTVKGEEWDGDTYAALAAYIEERTEGSWEEQLIRLRLPYEAASLEISMEIGGLESDGNGMMRLYPDITMGVRQLYEMIPEFL